MRLPVRYASLVEHCARRCPRFTSFFDVNLGTAGTMSQLRRSSFVFFMHAIYGAQWNRDKLSGSSRVEVEKQKQETNSRECMAWGTVNFVNEIVFPALSQSARQGRGTLFLLAA